MGFLLFRSITNKTPTSEKTTRGEASKSLDSEKRLKLRQISEPEVFSITPTHQHGHSRSLTMDMNEISVQLEGILEEQEPIEFEKDSEKSTAGSANRSRASSKINDESLSAVKETNSFTEVSTPLDRSRASSESGKTRKSSAGKKSTPKSTSNSFNRGRHSSAKFDNLSPKSLDRTLASMLAKARATFKDDTASFASSSKDTSWCSNSNQGIPRRSTVSESRISTRTSSNERNTSKVHTRNSGKKYSGSSPGGKSNSSIGDAKDSSASFNRSKSATESSAAKCKKHESKSVSPDVHQVGKRPLSKSSRKSSLSLSHDVNGSVAGSEKSLKHDEKSDNNSVSMSASIKTENTSNTSKAKSSKNPSAEKANSSKTGTFVRSFSSSSLGGLNGSAGKQKPTKTRSSASLGSLKPPKNSSSSSKFDGSGIRKLSSSIETSIVGQNGSKTPGLEDQRSAKESERDKETLKKLLNKIQGDGEAPAITASYVVDENSKSYYIKKIINSDKRREIQRILMSSDFVDKNLRESTAINDYYETTNIHQDESFNLSASASTFIVDQKDVNTTHEIHYAFVSDSYPASRRPRTPLETTSGNETFYCSPESGKIWGPQKVPKLDLSPLDRDAFLIHFLF